MEPVTETEVRSMLAEMETSGLDPFEFARRDAERLIDELTLTSPRKGNGDRVNREN